MTEARYPAEASSNSARIEAQKQSDMEKAMEATLKNLPFSSNDAAASSTETSDQDELKARQSEKFRLLLVDKVRLFLFIFL